MVLHRALGTLDNSKRLAIEFFKLEDTPRVLTRMNPSIVPIVRVGPEDRHRFWPRAARVVAASRDAADDDLDEGEMGDGGPDDTGHLRILMDRAFDRACRKFDAGGGDGSGGVEPIPVHPPIPPSAGVDGRPGSSGDALPPSPPPPAPHAVPRVPRTGGALATLELSGGTIVFYGGLRNAFEAVCNNPLHGRCVLTRGVPADKNADTGRPVGMLAAWLACNDQIKKEGHWERSVLAQPLEHRRLWRLLIKGSIEGAALLSRERRKRDDDEESEPETLDAYMPAVGGGIEV